MWFEFISKAGGAIKSAKVCWVGSAAAGVDLGFEKSEKATDLEFKNEEVKTTRQFLNFLMSFLNLKFYFLIKYQALVFPSLPDYTFYSKVQAVRRLKAASLLSSWPKGWS